MPEDPLDSDPVSALMGLLDPVPCRDEIIPDADSVPLSVLNYPLGKRHEIDFSAYDPLELTLSPAEEARPVSVLSPYSLFEILTNQKAWGVVRVSL